MKAFMSKIWFPAAVVTLTAMHTIGPDAGRVHEYHVPDLAETAAPDTVIYRHDGYKALWTAEDFSIQSGVTAAVADDSLAFAFSDSVALEDTLPVVLYRDTVHVPEELRTTDPFRYRYYAALTDSLTHRWVRDTLIAAGDSLDWPKLDSIYAADSVIKAKAEFDAWYASLDKNGRKKYDMEQLAKAKVAAMNRKKERKDSLQSVRDSIVASTPRVLETFALPDSLHYKRIVRWTHDREFHKLDIQPVDTSFNYRFHDYPFLRKDVNATWLGVAGSPVQQYNWFRRESGENVSFYEAQESWSWNPSTLPMYNTKTPYTELGYTGTLFANQQKESDNLHIMTSQNIWPDLNYTLTYDRYGGGGMLNEETTANKNVSVSVNRVGKRHLLHAGYIYNAVSRSENGGILDNKWIRDTTVDAMEIGVALAKASSKIKKNTLFLDQQYRIPFTFLVKKDTTSTEEDQPVDDSNVTTAFIGHSSEYSVYTRKYVDEVKASSNSAGKDFYNGNFFINPMGASDSLRVMRFENKAFIRLQPWSEDGIVSKLNVGIGDRLLSYHSPEPGFVKKGRNEIWNSLYAYAGVEGNLPGGISWDGSGNYVFLGKEFSDMDLAANAKLVAHPFRRARTSPLTIAAHFKTSLDEPEFYVQHMFSNHFRWDNDFKKISTTRISGELDIPHWNTRAEAGYALLANNIFYDTLGIVRQNSVPMSVFSASLEKNIRIGAFHFDNRGLFQLSSNQEVLPLPTFAINARWYAQLEIEKGVMQMQIGADAFWNTKWYSPAWNPELGVFHNQVEEKYNNGPYVDAFVNIQWKRACIFVKYLNATQTLFDKHDYFSAHHFIQSQSAVKFGIYWPFYTQPGRISPDAMEKPSSNNSSGRTNRGSRAGRAQGGSPGSAPGGLRQSSNR